MTLRNLALLPFAAVALLLCACASDPLAWPDNYPPRTPSELAPVYRLRPHDTVEIQFYQELDVNSRQTIDVDGYVNMKLLNKQKFEGMTVDELKEFLIKQYKRFYRNPSLSVALVASTPGEAYFHGYIAQGAVAIPMSGRALHLSEAIAKRGGIPARGNRNAVRLTRKFTTKNPDGTTKTEVRWFTIDVGRIEEGKAPDIPLLDGDRIYVPDTLI